MIKTNQTLVIHVVESFLLRFYMAMRLLFRGEIVFDQMTFFKELSKVLEKDNDKNIQKQKRPVQG